MRSTPRPLTERQAWIALAATPGVGDRTFQRLLEVHGNAREALAWVRDLPPAHADRQLAGTLELRLQRGLGAAIRASAADPCRSQRSMQALGGWVLTPLDAGYPARLHDIEEPPGVLYGLGDAASLTQRPMVAVVGTRRPSVAGRDLAARISRRLVETGLVVVSGLALGIDGSAHQAAIDGDGTTVAVVGGGLDAPGPASHRRLARTILVQGAIISELAPCVRPSKGTFPRRNRIVSGLAHATIVVEAPARSGALITARHALEQGRRLLVATGRPLDPRVAGNLALLRESPAMPLIGLDEMVADLDLDLRSIATSSSGSGRADAPSAPVMPRAAAALQLLEPTQRAVAQTLSTGPHSVDGLCRATSLEPGAVVAALTMLQLRGWARVLGATHLPAGPLLLDSVGSP